jgi:hypothetical protein
MKRKSKLKINKFFKHPNKTPPNEILAMTLSTTLGNRQFKVWKKEET